MAGKSESIGSFLLKALILLVVIAAGVFAGFWISSKTGLTGVFGGNAAPQEMINRSNVRVGDIFPPVTVRRDGAETDIRTLLLGKRSLVAFVSGACEPCRLLVEEAARWPSVIEGNLQVLLLTRTPEAHRGSPLLQVYEIPTEVLPQLEIGVFPTLYVINEAGEVRVALSGYSEAMTEEVLTGRL